MTEKSRTDMPRQSRIDMRPWAWPKGYDEEKRRAREMDDKEFFEDMHELMQLLRRKATAAGNHLHCPLPPCRRHRKCLSRNDPYERESFCASQIHSFLKKMGIV
jgi:hypothetical protein